MGLGIVVEFLRARRPSLWYLFSYVFPFFVLGRISSFFFFNFGERERERWWELTNYPYYDVLVLYCSAPC